MNLKQSLCLSIKQAADFLGVSKKTLMRWDEKGLFPAEREAVTRARIYHFSDVEKTKKWLDLRSRHLKHLRELPAIRKRLNKALRMSPVIPGQPVKPWSRGDVDTASEAIKAMEEWEGKEKEITKGYDQFRGWRYRRVDRKDDK